MMARVMTYADTMTEAQFQEAIVKAAKLNHWRVYFTWNSRHSPAGFPDLLMMRDGMMRVYELKTEKGPIRPQQREWVAAFTECGVPARIVRPSDLDDVLRELSEGGN